MERSDDATLMCAQESEGERYLQDTRGAPYSVDKSYHEQLDRNGDPQGNWVQRESVCCLLVLNSVTSTPQWIRQP